MIYICTYKDFTPPFDISGMKIIHSKELQPYRNLDDKFWSELLHFFTVDETDKDSEVIGFCHYRRYYTFKGNVPSIEDGEVLTATPLKFYMTNRIQYARCHNIEDLELIEKIIDEHYGEYSEATKQFLDGHTFYPYNMIVMRREDFTEYIKFIKGVMNRYLDIVGTDIMKRLQDNKDKYIKNFYPNGTYDYQYRIGGYLCERLTNIFILKHFKKISPQEIIITEKKYNKD